MAIVLGLVNIFVSSLIASHNIHLSTVAFYVADSGIEAALYQDRNVAGGLADGFVCEGNGDGDNDDDNENGDSCLDKLSNNGVYRYEVTGVSDPPTTFRTVTSRGRYSGVSRTVEVIY